jgi:hypothetical protein
LERNTIRKTVLCEKLCEKSAEGRYFDWEINRATFGERLHFDFLQNLFDIGVAHPCAHLTELGEFHKILTFS